MRAANPNELGERAEPVLSAVLSEAELDRLIPVEFQDINDPDAAAEPSKGVLIQLAAGPLVVLFYGKESGRLVVESPASADATQNVRLFLEEIPIPQSSIIWKRPDVALQTASAQEGVASMSERGTQGYSDQPLPVALPSVQAPVSPFKLRKLLVIDDDAKHLASYRDLLSPYGFEVLTAGNEQQSISLVERNPDIILVILDLAIPRMDGREWLRWYRMRHADSPVIVISAYKVDDDPELKPDAFLEKPFTVAELLDLVGLFCGLGTPARV